MSATHHATYRRLAASLTVALLASLLVALPPAPANASTVDVLHDFEGSAAVPGGFFTYNGGGAGIGYGVETYPDSDGTFARPGQSGPNNVLSVGFDVPPGGFAGFGEDYGAATQDWSSYDGFQFWLFGVGNGATYQVEIQEDPVDSDLERYDIQLVDDTAGWQLVEIPFSDFAVATDFNPTPGNGVLDLTAVKAWVFPIVAGSDTVKIDDIALFATTTPPTGSELVQDFDVDLGAGAPLCAPGAPPVGFCTFQGVGTAVVTSEAYPAVPARPGAADGERALRLEMDVTSFAGFINGFGTTEWTSQDWSTREGVRFWFHGAGTGTVVFVDVLENRNPDSTTDDAERFSVEFIDDVAGWRQLEFPFSAFSRKEIGNGAPNDGFDRFEVHGFALGTLKTVADPTTDPTTQGPLTFWMDDVEIYGEAPLPPVTVGFAQQVTSVEEGGTAEVAVKLNRALGPEDAAEVTVDYATERSYATPGEEFTPTSGTLTFVAGGPTEQTFSVETFDDTKFEGDEQIVTRLTNAVGAERSALFQGSVLITENDPFDEKTLDNFVQGAFLWDADGADLEVIDADDRPGQDVVEEILTVSAPVVQVEMPSSGPFCTARGEPIKGSIPVHVLGSADIDVTQIDVDSVRVGEAGETHVDRRTGKARQHIEDVNEDGHDDLVVHVRFADTGLPCDVDSLPLTGETVDGQPFRGNGSLPFSFQRDFALGQDWTDTESLDFWFRGAGAGDEVTVTLKDNRAPYEDGPDGWSLVWADEFDGGSGTVPDPANWAYEIGDTTPDAKNGWGNDELQYYTDDPDNASMDGDGNLVITLNEADEGRECYYGPCEYESARLLTQHKAEFAYGRIESRMLVPDGGAGLWPAFWSLGTDITYNPWPGAGEIDIMEYVSRLPNEIFGTVHGPGYQGGGSIGNLYTYAEPVHEAPLADGAGVYPGVDGGTGDFDGGYHTFTVEWEPDLIVWYVDGVEYHRVTPADLPGPWVFDKPFFLLLNFAVGGNFGGTPAEGLTVPQEFLVDYVRVYQGPDTAERFEATFTDDVAGWQRVSIPMAEFVRSDVQAAGAPDDGLNLDEVWGYGFTTPAGVLGGELAIDLVERVPFPPPSEVLVTTLADDGDGSLRAALATVADGGTITFDPPLAGTITLTSGELVVDRSVTIDGSNVPGLVISAGGVSRVLMVEAGNDVTITDVEIADGRGLVTGGGVLNFGSLTLERVVVRNNLVPNTTGTNFDRGGGGIYTGEGGALTLLDSVIRDNTTENQPAGGLYSFFGSTTTIIGSTITGNRAGDVAGGIRTLGTFTLLNSIVSDNTSGVFHGGGVFVSDSDNVIIEGSTITGNAVDDGTAGGLMVFAFAGTTTATVSGSTIVGNAGAQCQVQGGDGGGTAFLVSGGGNTFGDASCGPESP